MYGFRGLGIPAHHLVFGEKMNGIVSTILSFLGREQPLQ